MKRNFQAAKDLAAKVRLLAAFATRNITFYPRIDFDDPRSFEWSQLEVQLPWLKQVYCACRLNELNFIICFFLTAKQNQPSPHTHNKRKQQQKKTTNNKRPTPTI